VSGCELIRGRIVRGKTGVVGAKGGRVGGGGRGQQVVDGETGRGKTWKKTGLNLIGGRVEVSRGRERRRRAPNSVATCVYQKNGSEGESQKAAKMIPIGGKKRKGLEKEDCSQRTHRGPPTTHQYPRGCNQRGRPIKKNN